MILVCPLWVQSNEYPVEPAIFRLSIARAFSAMVLLLLPLLHRHRCSRNSTHINTHTHSVITRDPLPETSNIIQFQKWRRIAHTSSSANIHFWETKKKLREKVNRPQSFACASFNLVRMLFKWLSCLRLRCFVSLKTCDENIFSRFSIISRRIFIFSLIVYPSSVCMRVCLCVSVRTSEPACIRNSMLSVWSMCACSLRGWYSPKSLLPRYSSRIIPFSFLFLADENPSTTIVWLHTSIEL